jgi:hypothetical protein
MLGMLGISDYAIRMVMIVAAAAMLTLVVLAIYGGESGPGGFAYNIFRNVWYDFTYFFFGPRFTEV